MCVVDVGLSRGSSCFSLIFCRKFSFSELLMRGRSKGWERTIEVDAQFRIQPCLFIRSDVWIHWKHWLISLWEGGRIPDILCTHASPLVIVHQKEGRVRMAVDYREVKYLRVSANQLLYQDMLFQQLVGQQYYKKWVIINYGWTKRVATLQQLLHHGMSIYSW